MKACQNQMGLQQAAYQLTISALGCRLLLLPLTIFVTFQQAKISISMYIAVII
jgi:hypothetical protein